MITNKMLMSTNQTKALRKSAGVYGYCIQPKNIVMFNRF